MKLLTSWLFGYLCHETYMFLTQYTQKKIVGIHIFWVY